LVSRNTRKLTRKSESGQVELSFKVGEYKGKAKNDGGICVMTKGRHSGSYRSGGVPVVGFEVRNTLPHLLHPDVLTLYYRQREEYMDDITETGRAQEGRKA
jgi:hypothetical protein